MLLVVVFLVVSAVYVQHTWRFEISDSQKKAILLATALEAGLPKSAVASLDASPDDVSLGAYQEIKNNLVAFISQQNDARFAYLYAQRDGALILMVDSEPPGSADYSPPGQIYGEAPQEMQLPFQTGENMIAGPIVDRWGTWMSVLVPIRDPATDQIIAVLGVDYPAETWDDHAVTHTVQAGLVVFVTCLFILAFFHLLDRNKSMKAGQQKLTEVGVKLNESEQLFRTIFEQIPVGMAIGHTGKNTIVNQADRPGVNPMFTQITGRTQEEMETARWHDMVHPDDQAADLDEFGQFCAGQIKDSAMEKRIIKKDGSIVWINQILAPLQIADGSEMNYLSLIQDITDRKEMEKALRESERSKSVLLSHLPGMAYRCKHDLDWTMLYVSPGCVQLTGYAVDDLVDSKTLAYNDLIIPEHRGMLWDEWKQILDRKVPFRHEYQIMTKGGDRKWVLELGQGIFDENGEVEALEGIIIDISRQKLWEDQSRHMVDHDYLTGLHNRLYFETQKQLLDSQEQNLPISVIIADINGVRLINDAFGHSEGDTIIRETAKIIEECCRETDVLARTGGDEFSILMPNTSSEEAYAVLQAIQSACHRHNGTAQNHLFDISLSVGFGTRATAGDSMAHTVKTAEEYLCNRKLLSRKSSHNALLNSIMTTMFERSQETEEHAERIAVLAKRIGRRLELTQKQLDELELLSMLHDIGKIAIDDRILNKPGKLNDDEWAIMKKHPEIGYRIAMTSPDLESIADYILSHHERWDGKGYPQGLHGTEIPLLSRILAVADAFDAMTQNRVYRAALSHTQALEEILTHMGTQFDPDIARIFVESHSQTDGYPEPASQVRLLIGKS